MAEQVDCASCLTLPSPFAGHAAATCVRYCSWCVLQEDALAGQPSSPGVKGKKAAKAAKRSSARQGAASAGSSKQAEASAAPAAAETKKKAVPKVSWVGSVQQPEQGNRALYSEAQVGSWKVQVGKMILLEAQRGR